MNRSEWRPLFTAFLFGEMPTPSHGIEEAQVAMVGPAADAIGTGSDNLNDTVPSRVKIAEWHAKNCYSHVVSFTINFASVIIDYF